MVTFQCLTFEPYYPADCELTCGSSQLLKSHSISDMDSIVNSVLEIISVYSDVRQMESIGKG